MSFFLNSSKITALLLTAVPALAISDSSFKNPGNIYQNHRSQAQLASSDKLKTLIVSGFGVSLNEAIQNAAANALREVVGSFLSAESLLDKRVLIEKGIRSETKSITTSISEYSQGSIKSLDVLSSSTSNGVHNVNAKVVVRILDFRAYVKKLSSDSKELSKNIFAQIASEQSQGKNRIEILERNISKLAIGEASEISMQGAVRLSDIKDKKQYGRIINAVDPDTTVAIPFKVSIKEGFNNNLLKVLNETADQRIDVYGKFNYYSEYNPYTPSDDYGLIYIDPIKNIRSKFIFSGTGKFLKKRYGEKNNVHPLVHGVNCDSRFWIPLSTFERLGWETKGLSMNSNSIRCDVARQKRFSPLLVSLLDASGNVVLQDKIKGLPSPTYDAKNKILIACKRTTQYGESLDGCYRSKDAFSPYGFSKGTIPTIFKERNFLLLVQIPPATLGEVATIEIEITGQ